MADGAQLGRGALGGADVNPARVNGAYRPPQAGLGQLGHGLFVKQLLAQLDRQDDADPVAVLDHPFDLRVGAHVHEGQVEVGVGLGHVEVAGVHRQLADVCGGHSAHELGVLREHLHPNPLAVELLDVRDPVRCAIAAVKQAQSFVRMELRRGLVLLGGDAGGAYRVRADGPLHELGFDQHVGHAASAAQGVAAIGALLRRLAVEERGRHDVGRLGGVPQNRRAAGQARPDVLGAATKDAGRQLAHARSAQRAVVLRLLSAQQLLESRAQLRLLDRRHRPFGACQRVQKLARSPGRVRVGNGRVDHGALV